MCGMAGRDRKKQQHQKEGKKEACDSPPTHSCLSGDDACLSPLLPPCPSSRTQPTQKQQTAVLQPSKRWRGTVATGCVAAFTGYRESLRRSLSHRLSRRGRAPQSAHSGLRKESVAFISFFFFFFGFTCGHFYGRMNQTQTCHKVVCFHGWSSDFHTHPI